MAPFYPDQTRACPSPANRAARKPVRTRSSSPPVIPRPAPAPPTRRDRRSPTCGNLQMRTGPLNGTWAWLKFPLRAVGGAGLAGLRRGVGRHGRGDGPGIVCRDRCRQGRTRAVAGVHPTREFRKQHHFNKLMLLWAPLRVSTDSPRWTPIGRRPDRMPSLHCSRATAAGALPVARQLDACGQDRARTHAAMGSPRGSRPGHRSRRPDRRSDARRPTRHRLAAHASGCGRPASGRPRRSTKSAIRRATSDAS